MKNPHSHPAHRNVPDAPQADNPNMTKAAKDRSDRWAKDLDGDTNNPDNPFSGTIRHTKRSRPRHRGWQSGKVTP